MDPFLIRFSTVILSCLWPPLIFFYFIAAIFLKTHEAPFDRTKWILNYTEKYGINIDDFKKEVKEKINEEVKEESEEKKEE